MLVINLLEKLILLERHEEIEDVIAKCPEGKYVSAVEMLDISTELKAAVSRCGESHCYSCNDLIELAEELERIVSEEKAPSCLGAEIRGYRR